MCTRKSVGFVKSCMDIDEWPGPVIELGAGKESRKYQEYFKGYEYITLDHKQEPDGSINVVADILNMPQVGSGRYGVVLLCEVLEHLCNPFKAFQEIVRILRPGGLFICTTVSAWPLHKHPFDFWRFMPDGLNYLCAESGLRVISGVLEPHTDTSGQAIAIAAVKK